MSNHFERAGCWIHPGRLPDLSVCLVTKELLSLVEETVSKNNGVLFWLFCAETRYKLFGRMPLFKSLSKTQLYFCKSLHIKAISGHTQRIVCVTKSCALRITRFGAICCYNISIKKLVNFKMKLLHISNQKQFWRFILKTHKSQLGSSVSIVK